MLKFAGDILVFRNCIDKVKISRSTIIMKMFLTGKNVTRKNIDMLIAYFPGRAMDSTGRIIPEYLWQFKSFEGLTFHTLFPPSPVQSSLLKSVSLQRHQFVTTGLQ